MTSREIEVTIGPNGLKGTLTVPPAVDVENALGLGYAPATTKAALILHGQSGHRNYCYQKALAHSLAQELGMYTLRIDFRGCGESPDGPDPKMLGRIIQHDVEDIQHCAEFLIDAEKNPVDIAFTLSAIIGHSRGSLAMFLWAVEQNRLLRSTESSSSAIIVPSLVNCLARFRLKTVLDRYPAIDDEFIGVEQTCLRYGKFERTWVPKAELLSLATPDVSAISELSREMSVLSIYGLNDHIVPVEDSAHYANHLNRGIKSHELVLIPHADHNFYGTDEVITELDHEEFNSEGLPLTKKNLVNFNPKVVKLIVDYLSPDKEFERFLSSSSSIGHVPRWKHVEGISNFRDVGGWNVILVPRGLILPENIKSPVEGLGQLYVKPQIAFRCANMANVTDLGLQELQDLQVKVIFDLRSDGECNKDGIPQNLSQYGIRRVHAPVFTQTDYSPQAIAMRYTNLMTSWYTYVQVYDKLLGDATSTFRLIFEYIRDEVPKGGSFVFHCTAGKDRTGILAMLMLLLCGVDKHTVAREYELTTYGLKPDHESIKHKFVSTIEKVKSKLAAVGQSSNYEESIRQGRKNWTIEEDGFNNLISLRYEAMLSTIELFNSKYGGIVNYMKNYLGFSDEDLTKIYSVLVHADVADGFADRAFVKWDHRPGQSKI